MTLTPATLRLDTKCGNGAISEGEHCHKGTSPTRQAVAIGLGAAGLAAGGVYLATRGRRKVRVSPSAATLHAPKRLPGAATPRVLPGDRTTRRLTGFTPKGLLPPSPRKSKTQRMRENTQAAVRGAERDMGRAARAELERIGAVGNAMASAGEATGMAAKTTFRELRLRTEALRRRYEPGYRRPDRPRLPEGGTAAFRAPFTPGMPATPERIKEPRRRDAAETPWAAGFAPRFDAPEAGETNPEVAALFFKTLLDAVTTTHLLHLQSRSYAQHVALGGLYEELGELVDGLVESYQGKYGIVGSYPLGPSIPATDPITYVESLSNFIREYRYEVATDSELQNDIDGIQSLIDSTIYKLTNLR